jgi:hypothetical protein
MKLPTCCSDLASVQKEVGVMQQEMPFSSILKSARPSPFTSETLLKDSRSSILHTGEVGRESRFRNTASVIPRLWADQCNHFHYKNV